MKTFSCTSIPFRSFCPLQPILGRVKNEIAMMTDSLPSLQFSEVFTRSALPHSRPGYYMQCRLLTVSPFWLKLSYREYALVKGSLKDKQVTKKRNLCKSRNYCVDMGWMACALACLMRNHYHQHLTVQASADARDGLEAGLLWNVTLT